MSEDITKERIIRLRKFAIESILMHRVTKDELVSMMNSVVPRYSWKTSNILKKRFYYAKLTKEDYLQFYTTIAGNLIIEEIDRCVIYSKYLGRRKYETIYMEIDVKNSGYRYKSLAATYNKSWFLIRKNKITRGLFNSLQKIYTEERLK